MTSVLTLGLFMGITHALEADHVATVASLTARGSSLRHSVRVAALWGAGHAGVLAGIGAIIIALDASLPDGVARGFELAVAAMLIVLGIDVLRNVRTKRVHVHSHRHDGGLWHIHVHAHGTEPARTHSAEPAHTRNAPAPDAARHEHEHPKGLVARALVAGSVHGLAGSAALTLVFLRSLPSATHALAYLAVFCVGSILGMMVFSVAIALPLRALRHVEWASRGMQAMVGAFTIALGFWIAIRLTTGV